MTKTTALTHKPKCDLCGEPAIVTYRRNGQTINRCFDCLGPTEKEQYKLEQDRMLKQLGLIA